MNGRLPVNPEGRNGTSARYRAEAAYVAHENAQAAEDRSEYERRQELASRRYKVLADEYEYIDPIRGRRTARAGEVINISGACGSDLVYGFIAETTEADG